MRIQRKKQARGFETPELEHNALSPSMSPSEIEITTALLIKRAFERRKFKIVHHGDFERCAGGGKPDIELSDKKYHIIVEATKTTKSSSDREFNAVKDHLQSAVKNNQGKKCYCIYVSPETSKRNMDSFSLHNKESKYKIIPFNFTTFNYLIDYIATHDSRYFSHTHLQKLLEYPIRSSTTDADILEFANDEIIKKPEITDEIQAIRKIQQQLKNREIETIMNKIHNMLRRKYAKNPDEAVKEVSKIVFMKMYEEDKELRDSSHENRCTIRKLKEIKKLGQDAPLNYIFNNIKKEMKKKEPDSIIFDPSEQVELDEKTVQAVLELMNGQSFVSLGTDIKGRIYELFLGSTMKNTALGQYFTPEEVIKFIVEIAQLKVKDKIIDPCCGTGRFLTTSMDYLVRKAEMSEDFDGKDVSHIKKSQIFGIDLAKSVYKISRMNMYIHGDGKSNILNDNFITANPRLKGKFNVILTNPPFGDVNIRDDVENFEDYEDQIIAEFPNIQIETKAVNEDEEEFLVKSKSYKGGSLLIQRGMEFLQSEGKLITVIDEGILNTPEYANLRTLIKKKFFVKAMISLPQTTFKRLAKASPKSSIIYLVKKKNELDVQTEPIFFAEAAKVGIDTWGKPCRNDFDIIAKEFFKFSHEIEENRRIHENMFNLQAFKVKKFSGSESRNWWHYEDDSSLMFYILSPEKLLDRFDFAHNRPDLIRRLQSIEKHTLLKNFLLDDKVKKGITPQKSKDKKKEVPLLTITNIKKDGTIDFDNTDYCSREYFEKPDRKENIAIRKGDILMAITGATIGKLAIVEEEREAAICGDIARLSFKDPSDAIWIGNFLTSEYGQIQFQRWKNGSTNFHLSTTDIGNFIIADLDEKRTILETIGRIKRTVNSLKHVSELISKIEQKQNSFIPRMVKGEETLEEVQKEITEWERFSKKLEEFK